MMDDELTVVRREYILHRLRDNPLAVDFQLSLVSAALKSYRHDTVLRPFPPMFQDKNSENKDVNELTTLWDSIPALIRPGTAHLDESACQKLRAEQLELLHWVINTRHFSLSQCPNDKFLEIKQKTSQVVNTPTPNYIFEVKYSSSKDEEFENRRDGRKLWYAYHGSRAENFHSILHNGLAAHMNKNALFGEGTYLSSELSVSMPYAPTGISWSKSALGDKISCVAVCELIDDASVKCQVKDTENNNKENGSNTSKSRSRAPNSMGGEVPEKYYVVRNNEMLRVKWILVYADKQKPKKSPKQRWWITRHPMLTLMILYALFLLIIGLYKSKTVQFYVRRYMR